MQPKNEKHGHILLTLVTSLVYTWKDTNAHEKGKQLKETYVRNREEEREWMKLFQIEQMSRIFFSYNYVQLHAFQIT